MLAMIYWNLMLYSCCWMSDDAIDMLAMDFWASWKFRMFEDDDDHAVAFETLVFPKFAWTVVWFCCLMLHDAVCQCHAVCLMLFMMKHDDDECPAAVSKTLRLPRNIEHDWLLLLYVAWAFWSCCHLVYIILFESILLWWIQLPCCINPRVS